MTFNDIFLLYEVIGVFSYGALFLLFVPRQANLVLIAYASSESSGEPAHPLIQAVSQEEPSDRKPDPWPFWIAGHAQLKFGMTECSKTNSLDGARFILPDILLIPVIL